MTSIVGATAPGADLGAGARLPRLAPLPCAVSFAPYRCARSMLPCRPTLAVLQPCLQHMPALLWQSREEPV